MTDDLTSHLKVIDAAENMLIAYGMGWDMEGTLEVFDEASKEFQATDHSGNSRSDDVKTCERAIMAATSMRMGIKLKFSSEQIEGSARDLDRAIRDAEDVRASNTAPAP
ncbi:hypothetical protein [Sulfitobacter sp. R18_1]|uniref:hypothetical protein n=1 Tax=Sulfitobacter sp. R18_1 TaxID=2821104 RepID=UPI001ADD3479|nr:hypothetical protein [Sulfitobacter sp. R18_1]MBO9428829.1 hypothetical protein [Sulfitobacter sp. R18_1]